MAFTQIYEKMFVYIINFYLCETAKVCVLIAITSFWQELGVLNNPNYKIVFMLCSLATITVYSLERRFVDVGLFVYCN